MAQNEFFTPINQSPFGDVVFNCVGLPTVLDSHQGSWKTFSDQKELCTIELLSPPNIILKHADGRVCLCYYHYLIQKCKAKCLLYKLQLLKQIKEFFWRSFHIQT